MLQCTLARPHSNSSHRTDVSRITSYLPLRFLHAGLLEGGPLILSLLQRWAHCGLWLGENQGQAALKTSWDSSGEPHQMRPALSSGFAKSYQIWATASRMSLGTFDLITLFVVRGRIAAPRSSCCCKECMMSQRRQNDMEMTKPTCMSLSAAAHELRSVLRSGPSPQKLTFYGLFDWLCSNKRGFGVPSPALFLRNK